MSVSLQEVIENGGYNIINDIEDAKWLLGQKEEFEALCEKAEELVEKYEDYEDFIDVQENSLEIYDNPTFEEWMKNNA